VTAAQVLLRVEAVEDLAVVSEVGERVDVRAAVRVQRDAVAGVAASSFSAAASCIGLSIMLPAGVCDIQI
jgi:hypothetical protein